MQVCAYRQFIKYNWPLWDKQVPAWRMALPFWGYGDPPVLNAIPDTVSGVVTADLFPPPPLAVSACSPQFMRVQGSDQNWIDIPGYQTLTDRHRVILPDAAGYSAGSWNLLAWYNDPIGGGPITDPVRG
jgi:hypothetical protein